MCSFVVVFSVRSFVRSFVCLPSVFLFVSVGRSVGRCFVCSLPRSFSRSFFLSVCLFVLFAILLLLSAFHMSPCALNCFSLTILVLFSLQKHVSFLHGEFSRQISFPRKALNCDFALYTGGAKGKVSRD